MSVDGKEVLAAEGEAATERWSEAMELSDGTHEVKVEFHQAAQGTKTKVEWKQDSTQQ